MEPFEAERLARRAIALEPAQLAAVDEPTRDALARLTLRLELGGFSARGDDSLETLYRETLARRRRVLPPRSPGLVEVQRKLAEVLERNGRRLPRSGDFGAAQAPCREVLVPWNRGS